MPWARKPRDTIAVGGHHHGIVPTTPPRSRDAHDHRQTRRCRPAACGQARRGQRAGINDEAHRAGCDHFPRERSPRLEMSITGIFPSRTGKARWSARQHPAGMPSADGARCQRDLADEALATSGREQTRPMTRHTVQRAAGSADLLSLEGDEGGIDDRAYPDANCAGGERT